MQLSAADGSEACVEGRSVQSSRGSKVLSRFERNEGEGNEGMKPRTSCIRQGYYCQRKGHLGQETEREGESRPAVLNARASGVLVRT